MKIKQPTRISMLKEDLIWMNQKNTNELQMFDLDNKDYNQTKLIAQQAMQTYVFSKYGSNIITITFPFTGPQ